ncbi:NADPH-dependent 1-acyl dihydroxyacetone phosphate reductase [Microbotryomycetes sp. JL221]|nr:NADPH-dependent 1-acyl dihydroxyacetone phosphate reductase [Microbotryomycetes sp. JL221]
MSSPRKVVLVTGSSDGGIGASICQAFVERGCTVVATARKVSSMQTLDQPLVTKLELDVTSDQSVTNCINKVIDLHGKIDILVNNAGAGGTGALLDFTPDDMRQTFETNVFGVARVTQAVVPHMVKRKSGLVINIGSIVGNIATPWAGVYASSKAALHSWSEALRMEVKGFGINVMLVAPGSIKSNFGKKQLESFNMPENSMYKHVTKYIAARASAGQDIRSVPSSTIAQGIVSRALKRYPTTYYTAGGNSLIFWILERLPRWVSWLLLARLLGTNKV